MNMMSLCRKYYRMCKTFEVLHDCGIHSYSWVISTNVDINYAFKLFDVSPLCDMSRGDCFCLIAILMHLQIALKEPEKMTPYISIGNANCFLSFALLISTQC